MQRLRVSARFTDSGEKGIAVEFDNRCAEDLRQLSFLCRTVAGGTLTVSGAQRIGRLAVGERASREVSVRPDDRAAIELRVSITGISGAGIAFEEIHTVAVPRPETPPAQTGVAPLRRSGGDERIGVLIRSLVAAAANSWRPPPAACGTLPAGTVLDVFELVALVGRGGFGEVYKARHLHLGTSCAIKLLRPEGAGPLDALLQEAIATAPAPHPNIVQVLDARPIDEPFRAALIALELLCPSAGLPPLSLADLISANPSGLPEPVVRRWALEVCGGLNHCHQHGICHWDIKPSNILLGDGGRAVLADFGLARILRSAQPVDEGFGHTAKPEVAGALSRGFSAPELGGPTADHRADIYSLGMTLYHLLGGSRFADGLETGIPPRWTRLLGACTSPVRTSRPQSVAAVIDVIGSF